MRIIVAFQTQQAENGIKPCTQSHVALAQRDCTLKHMASWPQH